MKYAVVWVPEAEGGRWAAVEVDKGQAASMEARGIEVKSDKRLAWAIARRK